MKPRTKLQLQVSNISKTLPDLKEVLKVWSFNTLITHIGFRTKTKTQCLSCGHTWKGISTAKTDKCPCCLRKLSIKDTLKKKHDQKVYFVVFDVKDGFQIIRHFQLFTYHKAGGPPREFIWEIIQQYINPNGKNEVISRNRGGMGYYMAEHFHGDLEIRDRNYIYNKYDAVPDGVYPKYDVLPIYKRNGFRGKMGYCSPIRLLEKLTKDSITETLLKAKQYDLLTSRLGERSSAIHKYWNSIKICIRNRYIIKDAITYLDYLDLLQYCQKDLRSSVYVCPKDLKSSHDKLVAYKSKNEKRLKLESKLKKIEADQVSYAQAKCKYFGLVFKKGNITIKVLEHVREFFEEGETHHHCVFTNEYYKKDNTLIFSAKVKGVSVETIEVSLTDMKIIQSRGLQNRASEYNKDIISLMNRHLSTIAKRARDNQTIAA